ncbi:MAG: hypothetical protein L3J37_00580 [Rhodobacteraceae bacterium]|nr:hypothetical protein [Paracoccaceae bacterium]
MAARYDAARGRVFEISTTYLLAMEDYFEVGILEVVINRREMAVTAAQP